MSFYLGVTITAVALLVGSTVIAMALVKQAAKNRALEPVVPGPAPVQAAQTAAARADDRDALLLRMSHDLRAPLGSVVTLCQLLLDGDAGPLSMKQHQYVEVIRRGGQTVLGLVDDMLDLIALESGRTDVEPDLADVTALARQVADGAHATGRERGIPVQVATPSRTLTGRIDARRLRHVLARMVEHVVSATDHGYVEVAVEAPAAGAVEIVVRNTRDGLSDAGRRALEHGMDLEAPAGAASDGQPALPLAVAARLARRLGSPIHLHDDEGLALAVTVPLVGDGAAAVPREERPARAGTRLLLIDDDSAERDHVAAILQQNGYAVVPAASGEEGLRLMRDRSFEVVVLDLVMPGLSGLEVLRAARADGRLAHLPFIVLSAMYMTRTERAVLGPGVASVVRKGDATGDELLRAVDRALSAESADPYPAGDRHA